MYQRLASVVLVLAGLCFSATAAGPARNHPILGTWTFPIPGKQCSETYVYLPDGTTRISSGDEISRSAYTISATPSAGGYYKLSDVLTKDNEKPDCVGGISHVGDKSVNYIRFSAKGDQMIMCRQPSPQQCFGPLYRARDDSI